MNLLLIVLIILLIFWFISSGNPKEDDFVSMKAVKGYAQYPTIFPYQLYGYGRYFPYYTPVPFWVGNRAWSYPSLVHYSYPTTSGVYQYYY